MVTKKTAKTATAQRKKSATKKAKAATSKKKTSSSRRKPVSRLASPVTPEQRQQMIEEAAYYEAERRGFTPGNAIDDWLAAEALVDNIIKKQ